MGLQCPCIPMNLYWYPIPLTHWGRVTHICVSDLTSIGSDNGLSPGRRQAIIRTNAGLLLIESLGTNFNEILIEILIFLFKKMRLKVLSVKRRPFCLGLNVLSNVDYSPVSYCGLHLRAILQEMLRISSLGISFCLCVVTENPCHYWRCS